MNIRKFILWSAAAAIMWILVGVVYQLYRIVLAFADAPPAISAALPGRF